MGKRLTTGELTVVRYALSAYREIKQKDANKKKNAEAAENYERLLSIIDDTIIAFDGDVKSVYVNR